MGESNAPVAWLWWMGQVSNAVFDRKSAVLHCRLQCVNLPLCWVRVACGPLGDGQVELVGTSLASVDDRAARLWECAVASTAAHRRP
jgi:hypothetical protein